MGDHGPVAADKQRGKQTVRDMVISLAVILLAAWVIYLFVPHDSSAEPTVKPVSYRVELDSARRAAPYPVAAPQGLSEDWRATSVKYEGDGENGAAWHLGFMAPGDQYAAVEQTDLGRSDKFVEDVTHGAAKTSRTQDVGGEEWTRWKGEKYDALVREEPRENGRTYTTVVTGTASYERLGELAGALTGDGGQQEAGRGTHQP